MLLSKQQIFNAVAPHTDEEIVEWGGHIRLTAMTLKRRMALYDAWAENASQLEAFERDQEKDEEDREGLVEPKKFDEAVLTLIFAITDEAGELVFDLEDYDRFMELPLVVLNRLFDANTRLNIAQKPMVPVDILKKN